MELVELMEHLELLVPTTWFLHSCRDPATVFREVNIIEPLNKLAKLGDD